MKHMGKYLAGIALSLLVSAANAAIVSPSIELRPDSAFVVPGGAASFTLFADFGTLSTAGGALAINFDPTVFSVSPESVLSGDWFAFEPAFAFFGINELHSTNPATPTNWNSATIGFGSIAGITGAVTVGKLVFNVAPGIASGSTLMTLGDAPPPWDGGFFGIPPVSYGAGTTVAIATPVPLPPTVWIFASGLAMLGLVRLQRRLGSAESSAAFA